MSYPNKAWSLSSSKIAIVLPTHQRDLKLPLWGLTVWGPAHCSGWVVVPPTRSSGGSKAFSFILRETLGPNDYLQLMFGEHFLLKQSDKKDYDVMQYTAFDQLKQKLLAGKLSKNRGAEPSPQALSAFSAFALGAASKCIATCLTYPAIRLKLFPLLRC